MNIGINYKNLIKIFIQNIFLYSQLSSFSVGYYLNSIITLEKKLNDDKLSMADENVNSYEAMAAAAENVEEERRRKIQAIQRKRTIIGLVLAVIFISINSFFFFQWGKLDQLIDEREVEVRRHNFAKLKKPKSLYP